jgi:hypothetical protein
MTLTGQGEGNVVGRYIGMKHATVSHRVANRAADGNRRTPAKCRITIIENSWGSLGNSNLCMHFCFSVFEYSMYTGAMVHSVDVYL